MRAQQRRLLSCIIMEVIVSLALPCIPIYIVKEASVVMIRFTTFAWLPI